MPATDRCLLEDPRADRIVVSIRKLMEQQRILPYDPRTGRGFLRHVLVRVGAETGQVMVVLVAATPVFPQKKYFLPALLERHPEITTLVLNINPDYDGLMLGERETALYGPGYILDRLCGCDFGVSPRSFYQVNSIQTRALYETAMEYAGLTGRELAVDAYCGTGTIGLIASRHARRVIGVESNREAVRDAIANAKRNGIENAWFACEDAGRFLTRMEQEGQRAGSAVFGSSPGRLQPADPGGRGGSGARPNGDDFLQPGNPGPGFKTALRPGLPGGKGPAGGFIPPHLSRGVRCADDQKGNQRTMKDREFSPVLAK